jgi:hypothetical protein
MLLVALTLLQKLGILKLKSPLSISWILMLEKGLRYNSYILMGLLDVKYALPMNTGIASDKNKIETYRGYHIRELGMPYSQEFSQNLG